MLIEYILLQTACLIMAIQDLLNSLFFGQFIGRHLGNYELNLEEEQREYSAKIYNFLDYYESLYSKELEVDCMRQPIIAPIVEPSVSLIDGTPAEDLLGEIMAELHPNVDHHQIASYEEFGEPPIRYSDDYLTIDELSQHENIIPSYSTDMISTTKIADELQGKQVWMVSIVGMEEEYIHVSDGNRKWINVGEQSRDLQINDVLELKINRIDKRIDVLDVQVLMRSDEISTDYIIPDEQYFESTTVANY